MNKPLFQYVESHLLTISSPLGSIKKKVFILHLKKEKSRFLKASSPLNDKAPQLEKVWKCP